MIIAGNTPVRINGKLTRVLSRHFNRAFKAARNREETSRPGNFIVLDRDGGRIVPSKGMPWGHVVASIRAGKKVQAKVEGK